MDWGVILEMAVGIIFIILMLIGILIYCIPSKFTKKENRYDDRKVFKVKYIGLAIAIIALVALFFIL